LEAALFWVSGAKGNLRMKKFRFSPNLAVNSGINDTKGQDILESLVKEVSSGEGTGLGELRGRTTRVGG
jgi:hypothetical protein